MSITNTHLSQQVSPQPTGPSYKKSFSVFLQLTDALYLPSMMTLVTLLGTGTVFGDDQPIDFRLVVNSTEQISPLWLSSGFSIPNTIKIYSQAEFDTVEGATSILSDLNLAIIASQSEHTVGRIAEKFAAILTVAQATSLAPPTTSALLTIAPGRTLPTPFTNTKVFITTPSIVSACETFARISTHPNPSLIHGFALQYETILLSRLVTDINNTLHQANLETKFPYLNIKSIQNIKIRDITTSPSQPSSQQQQQQPSSPPPLVSVDDQPRCSFDFTHALVLNYPTPNRITPLAALLQFSTLAKTNGTTNFPPVKDQLQSDHNPLSPFPLLIAQHLKKWIGLTARGEFFTACVAVKKPNDLNITSGTNPTTTIDTIFQIRPISTYYGNTSTSVMFD